MKPKYYIISNNGHVGTIYEHEKYGIVLVFRDENINIKNGFQIYSGDGSGKKVMDVDLLDLISNLLPKE